MLLQATIALVSIAFEQKMAPVANNDDSVLFSKVKYRLVEPFRGGRSWAVTGDPKLN